MAPASTTPTVDAFGVVRATAQAAYTSGRTHLDRGEYLEACVDLDTARTNDPDQRPEIRQALDQALQRCLTPPPEPTAAQGSTAQRTIVVATVQVAAAATVGPGATPPKPPGAVTPTGPVAPTKPGADSGTPSAAEDGTPSAQSGGIPSTMGAGTPVAGVGTAGGLGRGTPSAASAATLPAPGTGAPIPTGGGNPAAAQGAPTVPNMIVWNDPQGRFSIGAPPTWSRLDRPQTLFGSGVVQFQDVSGRAQVDVAVDTLTHAVSPELYAASMELAMQQQVPGYASEQVLPGSTAGNPSIRRLFTFTQRDAAGQEHQARGFQVAVVKGSTPYIISGSAPAEQFQQYSPTLDRIVETFRFS